MTELSIAARARYPAAIPVWRWSAERRWRDLQNTHRCAGLGEVEGNVGVEEASERTAGTRGDTSYYSHASLAGLTGNQLMM